MAEPINKRGRLTFAETGLPAEMVKNPTNAITKRDDRRLPGAGALQPSLTRVKLIDVSAEPSSAQRRVKPFRVLDPMDPTLTPAFGELDHIFGRANRQFVALM